MRLNDFGHGVQQKFVEEVASVPYDVVDREQATAWQPISQIVFCMLFAQRLIYLK